MGTAKATTLTLTVLIFAGTLSGQDVKYPPDGEQLPPPSCASTPDYNTPTPRLCTLGELEIYQADLAHWRHEQRIRVGSNDSEYRREALLWSQHSFIQPQMMAHERYFYDPVTGHYTVGRYLDDLNKRYGGIDSVLIWPTYPNLGVDDRNQYDLFHDLPGGVEGIREMISEFHQHGVRVMFPVMLWDQGTRDEGIPDAEAISRELVEVGADGINGDTLSGVPRSFRNASDEMQHPLVLEPELGLGSDEMVNYNNMSWGYWTYQFAPSVSRYKWLAPGHMVNLSNRWGRNHTDDLQEAFFNGIGFESWENVWGIWNGFTPRDSEAIRRVATVERATSGFLVSTDWQPHTPTTQFGVFASKWPQKNETLWTIVNRNSYAVSGKQLEIPADPDTHFYDLWHGVELKPEVANGKAALSFDIESNGYGAILASTRPSASIEALMKTTHRWSSNLLSSYSAEWKSLPQTITPIEETKPSSEKMEGMVLLPKTDFRFKVLGIEIEGKNDEGVDVQYPWENSPRRFHDSTVAIKAIWMDKYPVTNREFKVFLDATHYAPRDAHNFLRDWRGGTFPRDADNRPVTWVSLEDARAYAKWAGKRLPHEWEWQYAAQGNDGRPYPWGTDDPGSDGRLTPKGDLARVMSPADAVDAHPAGASPFGVMDLVGNVWQWTDEYTDEHTRAGILRGGSHYRPQGTRWYFPQAYRNDQHGKYLLMSPGFDRSGAIGFRCVKDASD